MKYFEEELSHVKDIAKKNNYPVAKTFEQCITAIALAKEIQDLNKNFIFHGGTATQFYLGNFQRLSQDADMITNESAEKVKTLISLLEGKSGFNFKELPNGGFPVLRYEATHTSFEDPLEKIKVKVEITHTVESELPVNEIKEAEVFSCKVNNLITLEPTLLLPRKLLTFNIKNCGLREQKIGNIAKHTYDASSLIESFSKSDLIKSSKQFDLACKIETSFHPDCQDMNSLCCLENITNTIFALSNSDFPPTQYKLPPEIIRAYDGTANFLKATNRKNRAEWVTTLVELGIYTVILLEAKKNNDFNYINNFFSIREQSLKLDLNKMKTIDQELKDLAAPKIVRKREPRTRFLTAQFLRLRQELNLPINWQTPALFTCATTSITVPTTKLPENSTIKAVFIKAIHTKSPVKVKVNTYEKGLIDRHCIPFDFGPSNHFKDKSERFHFYDLNSPDGKHNLSILPEQLISIEALNETFDPATYVTWKPINWHVKRDWGNYS